jgi:hypothetical protein
VRKAETLLERQKRTAEELKGHDDYDLADAKIDIFEERLRLRIVERDQLEAFLKT